nr:hypothetical protein [Methylomarinum sp. Ch1-1]MDP4519778.1 hypothetical protein [Methylomarinum sp. Ch1-1]
MRIQADCLAANPPYGCDANVSNVGRLRVGWLREASHQNPPSRAKLALCVSGGLPGGESTLRLRCQCKQCRAASCRVASRSKPPKPRHRRQNWRCAYQRRIAWRRIHPLIIGEGLEETA